MGDLAAAKPVPSPNDARDFSALPNREMEEEHAVDPNRFTDEGSWAAPPRSWNEHTPEQLFSRGGVAPVLQEAIAALPASQCAVVMLRDVQGLESEEVCNILGISETKQRVLLHRARSKLRNALEEFLGRPRDDVELRRGGRTRD